MSEQATHFRVRNPRTGEVDTQIRITTAAETQQLAERARQAQSTWSRKSVVERVEVVLRWRDALRERRAEMVEALSLDTGRRTESELECQVIDDALTRWCRQVPDLLAASKPFTSEIPWLEIDSNAVPYALAGVISPWNFPLLLSLLDTIPAVLAGTAVMIKPSEVTPRFAEVLRESVAAVPALETLVTIVQGDGAAGAAVVDNVDMIVFTGSVATGRKVAEVAAKRFIPAFLELGGKDPAVILDDADIERTAAAIAWGGLANAGQSCLSIERVYVAESIHDDFVAALVNCVDQLRLNIDDIAAGQIGPVIASRQAEILERHLEDAFGKGAQAATGGRVIRRGGIWCEPTVLTGANHSMAVMTEETFGPILPVMSFTTVEEAIELANNTEFGLSGAVFGEDVERARKVAMALEAGAVGINDCALTAIVHEGAKQSFKMSGLGGSRMGAQSISRFFRKQALLENANKKWNPWWFNQQEQG